MKLLKVKISESLEFESQNFFPFVISNKYLKDTRSLNYMKSQDKFNLILSKRIQSAYNNQEVKEKEENEDDDDYGLSNIYCINNKDMKIASKIRLIKKIEKANPILKKENKFSLDSLKYINSLSEIDNSVKQIIVQKRKITEDSQNNNSESGQTITKRTITETSISFKQNFENFFKKSNSLVKENM